MIGFYHPGHSLLHRAPALLKLGLLSLLIAVTVALQEPWQLGVVLAVAVLLAASARLPFRALWRQVSPVLWVLAIAVPIQLLFADWVMAVMMGGRLLIAVLLAALFTLTTTVGAVLDACEQLLRPLRRWVDTDRIGLLLALTIRSIPVIAAIVGEVMEARKARGTQGSVMSLAVPVIVRSLQSAEALGDALIARGFDD
ncbi:energy-coupling factor transporter transmembrane component T family protein [Microterricola pindariensis]|uniref:Cobalt ABC transporter n=1 Tax=Microterricola pindariensis TaxID=478010 RepID=A0ABX5AVL0_9MICO|nr:energy-coupling factor transporter transmembrane protein EcfT [Microterricola pindariensis]PPL18973.1 hypothetical protein GY24_08390 [Microterricola pindariensis]